MLKNIYIVTFLIIKFIFLEKVDLTEDERKIIKSLNKDFKNNQFYYVLNQGELLSNNATIKQKLT